MSDKDTTTLWLGGIEEACHHSLLFKQGEPSIERVGMRVLTEEDLDLLQAHFAAACFSTEWVEIAHQGRTLHTTDPAGTPLEFCATMETRPRLFAGASRHSPRPSAGGTTPSPSPSSPKCYPVRRSLSWSSDRCAS